MKPIVAAVVVGTAVALTGCTIIPQHEVTPYEMTPKQEAELIAIQKAATVPPRKAVAFCNEEATSHTEAMTAFVERYRYNPSVPGELVYVALVNTLCGDTHA